MRNSINRLFLVALCAGLSSHANAQSDGLVYSDAHTAICMDESEVASERQECPGRSAEACLNANELGRSTIGMGGCLSKEHDFWDARLNVVYRQTMAWAKSFDSENQSAGMEVPSSATALRDMQRAWIVFRDKKCAYEHTQWGRGTGGGPAVAACLLHTTAQQTLFLEEAL